jgi:tetratricopeptide (TPR) repeat protein
MTEDPYHTRDQGERPGRPPKLVPPDAIGREKEPSSHKGPLLILACGLVLIIAALLVLFLPLRQSPPAMVPQAESQDTRQRIAASPPVPAAANSESAMEIERLIGTWLQKQAEAEAINVAAWGGNAYDAAIALAKECERQLGDQQYLPAREACAGALHSLDELVASKGQRLDEALSSGRMALEQGDPESAAGHFQRALAIDADDERVAIGMRRAEQLPAVLRFVQDGRTMETAGDLDGALLAFSKATELDPEFTPAREAVGRVRADLANRAFQQAMSNALQALADGRLAAAGTALSKAEGLRPGDRAVADLKQQLAWTQLAGRLTALRQDAERHEQAENWPGALKSCEEALSLDARAAFAATCKERASLRLNLDHRLKAILARPERLFEDGPLADARLALAQASDITPRGPVLAAQIDQLARLVTQAEAEVEVVIRSDGLTDVTIYHVGRLGLFQEKRLVLRTGDYTATGSRNGFRDVRQTLKVRPASGQMVFTLRCEEPI